MNLACVRFDARLFLVASLAIAASGINAAAADITFLCSAALQPAMQDLIPEFEKASGNQVKILYANIGVNTERVRRGDEADLAIVSPQQWDDLQKEGKLAPGARRSIAKVGIGVFVMKGAARPDISSVDAFKHALLSARSIAVGDPKSRSPLSAYMHPLFERLGINDAIRSKLRLTTGAPGSGTSSIDVVSKGEAEIGFAQMSEVLASGDVVALGPLPAAIQNFTILTAALPANARQSAAANALIDFLKSPRAVAVLKSKGFDTD